MPLNIDKYSRMKAFFEQNKGKFDIYEPKTGHEARFLQKLQSRQTQRKSRFRHKRWWVAAVLLFLLAPGWQLSLYVHGKQGANTEIRQNEQYFSMIIKEELELIKNEKTPETEKVFNDAMQQIKLLEKDYQKLVRDYRQNKDKYILNAMIENFRQRIEVLQFVKQQIKKIKETKTYSNEKHKL